MDGIFGKNINIAIPHSSGLPRTVEPPQPQPEFTDLMSIRVEQVSRERFNHRPQIQGVHETLCFLSAVNFLISARSAGARSAI